MSVMTPMTLSSKITTREKKNADEEKCAIHVGLHGNTFWGIYVEVVCKTFVNVKHTKKNEK